MQHTGRAPERAIVELGCRRVDADNPSVQNIHRGKHKSLSENGKRPFKRRPAIEPMIGSNEAD